MQITTIDSINLLGLDSEQVWDTDLAFEHLKAIKQADTKRTAERRIKALGLLPAEISSESLLDEHGRPPNSLVLLWSIDQARRQRKRVLFLQLALLPNEKACLHANDARGGRFWVPLRDVENTDIHLALSELQRHINRPIALYPHGTLVGFLRAFTSSRFVTFHHQAYRPVLRSIECKRKTKPSAPALPERLKQLEAEGIYALREAVAEAQRPALHYHPGIETSILLHLAKKAFRPAPPPLPLLHIEYGREFQETLLFRDFEANQSQQQLVVLPAPNGTIASVPDIKTFDILITSDSVLGQWNEADLWHYIDQESIPINPLHLAAPRVVVIRNGKIVAIDDEDFQLKPGEQIEIRKVRFPKLPHYPSCHAQESTCETVEEILAERPITQESPPAKPRSLTSTDEYLEERSQSASLPDTFVFPVQWINTNTSPNALCGTIVSGEIKLGDTIRVTASGQLEKVCKIVGPNGEQKKASRGEPITLILDKSIEVKRGDILSSSNAPLERTDQFQATLIWKHPEPGLIGRQYDLKFACQTVTASITSIKHRIDLSTGSHLASQQLKPQNVTVCNLALSHPVTYERHTKHPALGRFNLIDRSSRDTVATGLIEHSLRRAQNVHQQSLSIKREDREQLNGHKGKVIWFTGLSGSGKSTIANALEKELHAQGKRTYILDGDNVRQGLNKDLGFTDADRVENIRRVTEVAKLMMDAGLIVMTAFISPFRAERRMARELIGESNFIEVFVDTPLDVCEQRDTKGLYKKARNGLLPNMTGITSPYEAPEKPHLAYSANNTIQDIINMLI